MTRPDSPSQLPATIRTELELSKIRADMAHEDNVKTFLAKSGALAETSDLHQVTRASLGELQDYGLDFSPLLGLFDSVESMSPDRRRLSRKEGLQLLAPPTVLIPGVGTLPALPQEPIGRIEHAKRMVFGDSEAGK